MIFVTFVPSWLPNPRQRNTPTEKRVNVDRLAVRIEHHSTIPIGSEDLGSRILVTL